MTKSNINLIDMDSSIVYKQYFSDQDFDKLRVRLGLYQKAEFFQRWITQDVIKF